MCAKPVTLSVVCPAFNEEEVLPRFHAELSTVLDALAQDYEVEIVYVDDGSRDRTLAVLREMAGRDARVRYVSFSRNFGHQAALTAGLEASHGDVVITMDSDLQHPPALIPVLLEQWRQGNDIVLTIRDDTDGSSPVKRATSRLFYGLMRFLSDTDVRPAAADFRLMSRPAVESLLQMREAHRFLRGMVQWLGFASAEVHFTAPRRAAGHSKYSLRRMVAFAADGIVSFSKTPLRLVMLGGLLAIGFGLADCACVLLHGLIRPGPGTVLGLVFGSVYLVGGSILFALGVVGEYVGRIYEQVKARPLYVVKETHGAEGIRSSHPSARTRKEAADQRAAAA